MALDFQKFTFGGKWVFILIGVNYECQYRLIEMLAGHITESEALKSSKFFSEFL